MKKIELEGWAVILGASSGFGGATAKELASCGLNICGVHLDRKATQPLADEVAEAVKAAGREALFFNINASDEAKRGEVIAALKQKNARVTTYLHSLAFGTLKPYIGDKPEETISKMNMEMTLDVMGHSLVYWAQDLVRAGLLVRGGRIFAMTSEGDVRAWKTYGAVSAAKTALEAHIRQLAVELAPLGVTANAIRAGVTDTAALRKIPGSDKMVEDAKKRNPAGRMTTPGDVAQAIALLSRPEASWITGNVIGVDGGEFVSA